MNFLSTSSLVFFLLLLVCYTAQSSTSRKRVVSDEEKDSQEKTVFERNLVTSSLSPQKVLREHKTFSLTNQNKKNFTGISLAYLTPWNKKGYELSLKFRAKFDILSPCWYQIKKNAQKQTVSLTGQDAIDTKWLKDIKTPSKESKVPKITPRFLLDWQEKPEDLVSDLADFNLSSEIYHLIITECKTRGYDGVVIDFGGIIHQVFHPHMVDMLIHLSKKLHEKDLALIVAVPPSTPHAGTFTAELFVKLANHVDLFSLMTYDLAHRVHPVHEPIAPMPWVIFNLRNLLATLKEDQYPLAAKILVGLNFYGKKLLSGYAPEPLIAHELLNALETQKPSHVEWTEPFDEHIFHFKNGMDIYFPTLLSIHKRIEVCRAFQTGIAIWELGQGLDYFMDLL